MVMVKISVTVNCYTVTEPHRQILKSYGTCNIVKLFFSSKKGSLPWLSNSTSHV